MFDPESRYAELKTATLTVTESDGSTRQIRYVLRRFLPNPENATVLTEHYVTQGERLDNITALYLDDPTQFWRLCDANNVMRPEELTDEIGRSIRITMGDA